MSWLGEILIGWFLGVITFGLLLTWLEAKWQFISKPALKLRERLDR